MKKKLRPLGHILLDVEELILEMNEHDLQWGDYFGLLKSYLEIHLPDAQEKYVDGGFPEFYYGPRRNYDNRRTKK